MTGLFSEKRRARKWGISLAVVIVAAVALSALVAWGAPTPTEPGSFTATAGSSAPTIAQLSWTASTSDAGSMRYKVSVATATAGPYVEAGDTAETSFEFTNGFAGTPYYFRLAAYDAVGNHSTTVQAGPVSAAWKSSPHVTPDTSTESCGQCHSVHGAEGGVLMRPGVSGGATAELDLCYSCHDGRGAEANVKDGSADSFALASGHAIEGTAPADADLTNQCSSCHSTHPASSDSRMLPRSDVNSASVDTAGPEWCYACHTASEGLVRAGLPGCIGADNRRRRLSGGGHVAGSGSVRGSQQRAQAHSRDDPDA